LIRFLVSPPGPAATPIACPALIAQLSTGARWSVHVAGGPGQDLLRAGGDSKLYGGAGEDVLQARAGSALDGGPGNDDLDAQDGSARLAGGDGDDTHGAGGDADRWPGAATSWTRVPTRSSTAVPATTA
jgi:hypothetical protein